MSKYKCEFCNKEFSTKTNLTYHKAHTRYCLEKRGSQPEFTCEECKKTFVSDNMLQKHHLKCVDYQKELMRTHYEKVISEKDKRIKDLEDRMHSLLVKAVSYNYIDDDPRIIEIYQDEKEEDEEEEEETMFVSKDENHSLEPLNLTDNYTIEYREEDGYINVTNLCKAGGKQFKHWNSIEKTKGFLKALSSSVGLSTSELIKYKSGSIHERATWVHPQVAINIAQWISPEFDVKVSGWVYEIMVTGKVDIKNTKSYKQLQKENKDHQLRIKVLENRYLKKHKRTDYNANNVIYVLATESSKKNNIYILGKATNLTNRLSVYNKSEEHQVIFYKECSSPELMSSVEGVIFQKLDQYRQQANRERFILPEGKDISLFTTVIEKCIQFLEEK
jgi:hypothetical protein